MTNIKPNEQINIVIYNAIDGQVAVTLYAKDGRIWLNQLQMFELFAISKQTVSYHISNILKKNEFSIEAVGKKSLPTASDGKQYRVVFYSLEMILAVGYRAKGVHRNVKQVTLRRYTSNRSRAHHRPCQSQQEITGEWK